MLSIFISLFIFGVTIPLFMTTHNKIHAQVSDLTNTTWIINQNITITTGYGDFSVDIESNDIDEGGQYEGLAIGYRFSDYAIGGDFIEGYDAFLYMQFDSSNINGYTLTITGGIDTNNIDLINWLESNATLIQETPTGTEITNRYWAPYGTITIQDNTSYRDNDITYTVLYNQYTERFTDTTQTGLVFLGMREGDERTYIESINGVGINLLYMGTSNIIDNTMWLEFTIGDYIDTDLYNFMDTWGLWFNDSNIYLVGTNQGYVEGTIHGIALGQQDGIQYTGLITNIFNGLGSLLSIQVFPNITIGLLIGLPLLLGVFIIIIKIIRG